MYIKIKLTDYSRTGVRHVKETKYIWIQLGRLLIRIKYEL